ncbi:hypothetical protein HMPREF1440_00588, partial [Helicobacter pylori HP250AFiV]
RVFLIQSLDFFHFLELKRFLKSFHSFESCLSVTLLAYFNKDQLFLVTLHSIKPSFEYNNLK